MPVSTKSISVRSKGENDMIDITGAVQEAVSAGSIQEGIATIFVSGSTAAVTTIEYEPGLRKDFPKMLERVAPKEIEYSTTILGMTGTGIPTSGPPCWGRVSRCRSGTRA